MKIFVLVLVFAMGCARCNRIITAPVADVCPSGYKFMYNDHYVDKQRHLITKAVCERVS